MIDLSTFKQMHPQESKKESRSTREREIELTPKEMAQKDPPQGDSFVLCLPKVIPGFDMNKKEWSVCSCSGLGYLLILSSLARSQPSHACGVEYSGLRIISH